jgi:acetolactate synthase-1/3 small subunit
MMNTRSASRRHTLVVQLNDRPGALYRAIGLIRRRDYNVASLVVGATGTPGTSRMVLVVEAVDIHQVVQQLSRLIDVLAVAEVPHEDALLDRFVQAMRHFDLPLLASPSLPNAQELAR